MPSGNDDITKLLRDRMISDYLMTILHTLGRSWTIDNGKLSVWKTIPSECTALQHTATHCNTLQRTALHCTALQHTATHCNTLQHTATHSITLQHIATHSNTLHHTAVHGSTMHCNTPQHTSVRSWIIDNGRLSVWKTIPSGNDDNSCSTRLVVRVMGVNCREFVLIG